MSFPGRSWWVLLSVRGLVLGVTWGRVVVPVDGAGAMPPGPPSRAPAKCCFVCRLETREVLPVNVMGLGSKQEPRWVT